MIAVHHRKWKTGKNLKKKKDYRFFCRIRIVTRNKSISFSVGI